MATGLLSAALAASLAVALWVAWRARARVEREREAHRALEALVEQGTDLLAASLTTLEGSARRHGAPSELALARDATRGAARLLEAAHAYAAHPERRLPRAEGCVRVGVGLARSRGVRVLVSGPTTQLRSEAGVEVTCRTVAELLVHAARGPMEREVLELTIAEQHLEIGRDGDAPLPELEPRHRQDLEACGWTLGLDAGAWRIAPRSERGLDRGAEAARANAPA